MIDNQDSEIRLENSPVSYRFSLRGGVRYIVSGYIRTSPSERTDASVAIFDFSSLSLSEETLRSMGFVKSRIGHYSYLPTLEEGGISVWCFALPVGERDWDFGISFRLWRNDRDIYLGKSLRVTEDRGYPRPADRDASEMDIVPLFDPKRDIQIMKNLKLSPFSIRLDVDGESQIAIRGTIRVAEEERRNPALVGVSFDPPESDEKWARSAGLSISERVGLYRYIPTPPGGTTDWDILFRTPPDCKSVYLTFMHWYAREDIYLSLKSIDIVESDREIAPEYIEYMLRHLREGGIERAYRYIDESGHGESHKSALYEELALHISEPKISAESYLKALRLLPSMDEREKLLSRIYDRGEILSLKALCDIAGELLAVDMDTASNNPCLMAQSLHSLLVSPPAIVRFPISPPRKGRVLYLMHASPPHHNNGYCIRSHGILRAMKQRGETDIVAMTRPGYPYDTKGVSASLESEVDGIEYLRLSGADISVDSLTRYIEKSALSISKAIDRYGISTIHASSSYTTALPALIASRRAGIPFIYEVRGLWEVTRGSIDPSWYGSDRYRLDRDMETLVASNADRVVTITRALEMELIRRGVDGEKIVVVPNGVDSDIFTPMDGEYESIENLPAAGECPIVGYIGSIVEYEGLDDLLEALYILKNRGVACRMVIVGDGRASEHLQSRAKELGISDFVVFTGRIPFEEVVSYYSAVDIAVYPRKAVKVCEMVSPLKPLEAMAMGKAILASDVDAMREMFSDGETALLYTKGDIEDLARKLEILVTDSGLRSSLGAKAREWVESERRWKDIVADYEKIYEDAARDNDTAQREVMEKSDRVVGSSKRFGVLIYADVNLGYIDGSSIWLVSFVQMLHSIENVDITLLLKAIPRRDILLSSLPDSKRVKVIYPRNGAKNTPLTPSEAVGMIVESDTMRGYDSIVLRGFEVCKTASEISSLRGRIWSYPIDIYQKADRWSDDEIEKIVSIAESSQVILYQTLSMRNRLLSVAGSHIEEKTVYMPPMIPKRADGARKSFISEGVLQIVYAGKFAPLWGIGELLSLCERLIDKSVKLRLHIYGDKFHDASGDGEFKRHIEEYLHNREWIVYHGAKSRREVFDDYPKYDIGWAWRNAEFERKTDEISTKLLEYASAGLPVVSVPTDSTISLFGEGYPLFAEDMDELENLFVSIYGNPTILQRASEISFEATVPYLSDEIAENIFSPLVRNLSSRKREETILFAGHDMKFAQRLADMFRADGYRVLMDIWHDHGRHDEEKSLRLLAEADVVFCEWAMGNAVWYSRRKRDGQRLFIRFHRQEMETEYPRMIDYDSVDGMLFVSKHIENEAIALFGLESLTDRVHIVPNYVDMRLFSERKIDDARYNIGICGIVPSMKRFDLALDIVEALRERDERYRLFVKGKKPDDYPWLTKRPEEMEYYRKQMDRIRSSHSLGEAVVFDGYGDDIGEWLRKIGFILSTSDFEAFHLSVAEAMASGSRAVILRWKGAEEIYPHRSIFDDVDSAVEYIYRFSSMDGYMPSHENISFIEDRYDLERIYGIYRKLIFGE